MAESQDIESLTPMEDSMLVPFDSKPTVEERKEQIEYYFRIKIHFKDPVNNIAVVLSLKGKEKERTKARKFIQALYDRGADHQDKMVPVKMEMYGFASARPVLRHIVRESGAAIFVTFYGVAQVYGTEMAVILAESLFDHLTSQYDRGKNALALSPRSPASASSSASASASSSSSSASSVLANFVMANERNLEWTAEEVRSADIPQKCEQMVVDWLVQDLSEMGFSITNLGLDRPSTAASPVTGITKALRSASFHGVDASFHDGDVTMASQLSSHTGGGGGDDTIIIDDDEELDLIALEPEARRRVTIVPRSNLPAEYLDSLATSRPSVDIQTQKNESYRRMNILQEHNGVVTHPPPHPLVASSHHSPPNRPFSDDHGHSPRPPSSKKIKSLDENNDNRNTGNSKKDPVSNNSTKFKEDGATSSSDIVSLESGNSNRKVILKKNCSSNIEPGVEEWMVGLSDEQIAEILEQTENIDRYSNYANHVNKKNDSRTDLATRHPPPPPHRLISPPTESSSTMIIHPPIPDGSPPHISSSPPNHGVIPEISLRRINIDGSNVARAHSTNDRFSCRGILFAVQYFLNRGHDRSSIKVFIPQWRQNTSLPFNRIDEPRLLETDLADFVKFTPCRTVDGHKMNSYDDRFIVEAAAKNRGVIVSNDKFRDLLDENPSYKDAITYRLLPYVFVEDLFMPPQDPCGQFGPKLDQFLKIYRPEMEQYEHARPKQASPPLQLPALQQPQYQQQQQQQQPQYPAQHQPPRPLMQQQPPAQRHVQVLPPQPQPSGFNFGPVTAQERTPPRGAQARALTPGRGVIDGRSAAETEELRRQLTKFFEGQSDLTRTIDEILRNFAKEKDVNTLASHVCAILI